MSIKDLKKIYKQPPYSEKKTTSTSEEEEMRPEADHGEASARKKVICRVFCGGRLGSSSIEGTAALIAETLSALAFLCSN
jgi:hypothetical protein